MFSLYYFHVVIFYPARDYLLLIKIHVRSLAQDQISNVVKIVRIPTKSMILLPLEMVVMEDIIIVFNGVRICIIAA